MFEYKIDGPGLKDGVPIHIASSALDNFQSIVDKAFLVSIGSKRLSAKDRERFQLKATRFENGSFLTYFDIVLAGVQLTLPFAGTLGPQKLDHISAGPTKHKEPDIFIGKDDKHIFDIPTRIEKESVKLDCEIFDFNKYKHIGKLSIKNKNQVIPTGQYNFMISGSQNSIDYIYSMLEPSVTVICNVEMESNPFGCDDKVHKLHIIGVDS